MYQFALNILGSFWNTKAEKLEVRANEWHWLLDLSWLNNKWIWPTKVTFDNPDGEFSVGVERFTILFLSSIISATVASILTVCFFFILFKRRMPNRIRRPSVQDSNWFFGSGRPDENGNYRNAPGGTGASERYYYGGAMIEDTDISNNPSRSRTFLCKFTNLFGYNKKPVGFVVRKRSSMMSQTPSSWNLLSATVTKETISWPRGSSIPNISLKLTQTATNISAPNLIIQHSSKKSCDSISSAKFTLHQFQRTDLIPCVSVHGMKLETMLRIIGISFRIEFNCDDTGPWISNSSGKFIGADACINFLKLSFQEEMKKITLTNSSVKEISNDESKMKLWNATHLLDPHLFWAAEYLRFMSLKGKEMKEISDEMLRNYTYPSEVNLIQTAASFFGYTQMTHGEILDTIKKDLVCLSNILGSNEYFSGETPSELDCLAFSILCQLKWGSPKSMLKMLITDCSNLNAYCIKMKKRFWPDWSNKEIKGAPIIKVETIAIEKNKSVIPQFNLTLKESSYNDSSATIIPSSSNNKMNSSSNVRQLLTPKRKISDKTLQTLQKLGVALPISSSKKDSENSQDVMPQRKEAEISQIEKPISSKTNAKIQTTTRCSDEAKVMNPTANLLKSNIPANSPTTPLESKSGITAPTKNNAAKTSRIPTPKIITSPLNNLGIFGEGGELISTEVTTQ